MTALLPMEGLRTKAARAGPGLCDVTSWPPDHQTCEGPILAKHLHLHFFLCIFTEASQAPYELDIIDPISHKETEGQEGQ